MNVEQPPIRVMGGTFQGNLAIFARVERIFNMQHHVRTKEFQKRVAEMVLAGARHMILLPPSGDEVSMRANLVEYLPQEILGWCAAAKKLHTIWLKKDHKAVVMHSNKAMFPVGGQIDYSPAWNMRGFSDDEIDMM